LKILDESTSKQDFLEYLLERINSRSINLFLGAGMSKKLPSNLPLSNEFRALVFEKLCIHEKIGEIYEKYVIQLSSIPFESFVKLMIDGSDFFKFFLSAFGSGKPNKNHLLITELVANGLISKILTTNFDIMLEQAVKLRQENLDDLKVVFDEKHFDKLDLNAMKTPVICKIHGSIQEPSSIRVTLDLISRQSLQQARANILDYFFRTSGKDLLVLGYSCSDKFDINPFLKNLKSKINVLIIKHEPTNFKIEKLGEPFEAFSGIQVACNTDDIIDYFWDKFLGGNHEDTKTGGQDWKKDIHSWSLRLDSAQRLYLVGNVLLEMRELDESILLFNQGLHRAPNKSLEALILTRLGSARILKGNYVKASELYRESLPLLEEGKDDIKIAEIYHFLGMIEKLRSNYDDAEDLLKRSLAICQRSGFLFGTATAMTEMGTIYQRKGDFEKGKALYSQSLVLDRKIGNVSGMAVCLHQLGMIRRIEGDVKRAENFFKESHEIRKKLGDKHGIAASKHELGLCALKRRKLDVAEKFFEEALQILEELGDQARIAWTLHELGTVFYVRGDYDRAEELIQRSIQIKRSNNDQKGISDGLAQIGVIRMQQGRYDEAERLLSDAYEISKKLEDKHTMKLVLRTLEMLYSRKRDLRKLYRTVALRESI